MRACCVYVCVFVSVHVCSYVPNGDNFFNRQSNEIKHNVYDEINRGLDINKEKSYVMVFSKKAENPNCSIRVKGDVLKQNKEFQYLGSWVTSDWKIRLGNKAPDWDGKDSLQENGKGLSITQHQVCNKTASFKVL